MNKIKEFLKFKLLPKKLYLKFSAHNKLRRVKKKKETELLLLPYLIDKNKDAIDVGANTGLYTYFLSNLAKNVYAFEPHTNLATFLDKATKKNVTVINKALSNTQAILPFYIPVTGTRKHLNIASLNENIKNNYQCVTEKIQTITLDELRYKNIGFIKIDVEGHELLVLKGAINTIKDQKPTILIEILDIKDNPELHPTIKFLIPLGYEIFVMQNEQLKHINNVDHKRLDRNYICFAT
ncbi:MAG: FkbM family methyltransferase [Gammaproteobacteria bacterium]|jgi:FkbM family methyltransferase